MNDNGIIISVAMVNSVICTVCTYTINGTKTEFVFDREELENFIGECTKISHLMEYKKCADKKSVERLWTSKER
jgi:hypothetical protein